MIVLTTIVCLTSLFRLIGCHLSPEQKNRCEQYLIFFETNSVHFNYGYCHNLNDGNGFTAGRSYFTTRSGDAYEVVRRYSLRKPNNPLSKYESELKRLKELNSGDVQRLEGFERQWSMAADTDYIFRFVQDKVNDDLYYRLVSVRLFT